MYSLAKKARPKLQPIKHHF